jgi:hypothetical protein
VLGRAFERLEDAGLRLLRLGGRTRLGARAVGIGRGVAAAVLLAGGGEQGGGGEQRSLHPWHSY